MADPGGYSSRLRTAFAAAVVVLCSTGSTLFEPVNCSHQAPLSLGFSRQEYWSGLPFPTPGIFLTQGWNPLSVGSPALAGRLFTTLPPGKPKARTVLCGWLNKAMVKQKLQHFGHLMQRADSLGKTGQKEKRVTENEMVGWHHRLNGHELEQIQGDGEGQGSLECCSSWSRKESDTI